MAQDLVAQVEEWLDLGRPDSNRLLYTAVEEHDGPAYFVVRQSGQRYRTGPRVFRTSETPAGRAQGPVVFDTAVVSTLCAEVRAARRYAGAAESMVMAAADRERDAEDKAKAAKDAYAALAAEHTNLKAKFAFQWWALVLLNVAIALAALAGL